MSDRNEGLMITGLLLGAAVGAALGLLLAPASGETTRRRLMETGRKLKDDAQSNLEDVKHALGDRAKDVGDALEEGRHEFRRVIRGESPAQRTL